MLVAQDLYPTIFEEVYLQQTKDFYTQLSSQKLQELNPARYVTFVQ